MLVTCLIELEDDMLTADDIALIDFH